ncbi:hypothetical protein GCM10019059_36070 [Camelimonas fluminis]|uniref:Uncharacterized protein n=1 Tax=Camelimonas fluminis TaxID=1576911 RepID=A0ABV7UGY9_9HYPH|nr:hypothetical protein [Camelimonas fluminis]GHE73267.1 hypothetical protein GCM10019059_36070 [Camelimonas fluminis]
MATILRAIGSGYNGSRKMIHHTFTRHVVIADIQDTTRPNIPDRLTGVSYKQSTGVEIRRKQFIPDIRQKTIWMVAVVIFINFITPAGAKYNVEITRPDTLREVGKIFPIYAGVVQRHGTHIVINAFGNRGLGNSFVHNPKINRPLIAEAIIA